MTTKKSKQKKKMKKKKPPKKAARQWAGFKPMTAEDKKVPQLRVRKFSDVNFKLKHPKPIPGFKPTLPDPPGGLYKMNPGP